MTFNDLKYQTSYYDEIFKSYNVSILKFYQNQFTNECVRKNLHLSQGPEALQSRNFLAITRRTSVLNKLGFSYVYCMCLTKTF